MILIFVLAALALLAALVYRSQGDRATRLPATRAPAGSAHEPRCGRCGYIVLGLQSFTCPECGGDLRQVGIDAGQRRGVGVGGRGLSNGAVAFVVIAGWGVMVGAAARMTIDWFERSGPRVRTVNFNAVLAGPRSAAYDEVQIVGAGKRSGSDGGMPSSLVDVQRVTLTVTRPLGLGGTMTVDVDADRYTVTHFGTGATGSGTGFSRAAVADFIAKAAGPGDPALIDGEAAEAFALVRRPPRQQAMVAGQSGGSTTYNGGNETESMSWKAQPASNGPFKSAAGDSRTTQRVPFGRDENVVIGGLAVWAAGAWWVVRRSRAARE